MCHICILFPSGQFIKSVILSITLINLMPHFLSLPATACLGCLLLQNLTRIRQPLMRLCITLVVMTQVSSLILCKIINLDIALTLQLG